MAEKAALAQENARLHRENTNLQELLSYTVQQRPTGGRRFMCYHVLKTPARHLKGSCLPASRLAVRLSCCVRQGQGRSSSSQKLLCVRRARPLTGAGSGSAAGSDDEDALSDWSVAMEPGAACPSIDNGVSPVKMARRRLSMGADSQ